MENKIIIVKCSEHSKKKPCVVILSEGKCWKNQCLLFPRVAKMVPKLKRMHELRAKGVILTSVWNFSKEAEEKRRKQKEESENWLEKMYPRIISELKKKRTNKLKSFWVM